MNTVLGENMQCKRCLNEDREWFYKGSKGWYCRKCIAFGRAMVEEEEESVSLCEITSGAYEYQLKYPLTPAQENVAYALREAILQDDVLVQAVCGAGKTEIVIPTIASFLRQHKKVCFAIPRRQVVLEVAERLQTYFNTAKVIAVCGGHTDVVDGDLIVCTTHQLYRYAPKGIDLLILDEPDAFPYRNNEVLFGISKAVRKGHCVYLTSTPDAYLKNEIQEGRVICLKLNVRPHGKPIPVPRVIKCPMGIGLCFLIRWLFAHKQHPRIVFVPTIRMSVIIGRFLNLFLHCSICSSKTENRDAVIEGFRKEGNGILIATTVMERGVTIPHADVCVLQANHSVFDEAGLVQMAGRAGRDFQDPTGDVLFLCTEECEMVNACVQALEEANLSCGV